MSPASAETANVDVTTTPTECQGGDAQIVSPYQISWRSVIPLPRYGDFFLFFSRWRPTPSWICKISNY